MNLKEMNNKAVVLGESKSSIAADLVDLMDYERRDWVRKHKNIRDSGDPHAADGIFYHDTRAPHIGADLAPVTLSTTAKALYSPSAFPVLGGQYFNYIGKKIHLHLFGKITTAATPGNGSFDIYYGTGADANGVILASSAALALTAAQTNLSWEIELWIRCITLGSTGTLRCTGKADFNVGVLASTLAPMMIPASASVDSAAVDLTAALIPSIQFKRSGSTVETMTVQELVVTSLN